MHQFAPDISHAVWLNEKITDGPGLSIPRFGGSPQVKFEAGVTSITVPPPAHLNIYLKEYYRDFKEGVEKYYSQLLKEVETKETSQPLTLNFVRATGEGTQL